MVQEEILLKLVDVEMKLNDILSVLSPSIKNAVLSLVQELLYQQANLCEGNSFDRATSTNLN